MSSRVYIGRLGRDVRERDVEKLLKGCGDVREITLKNGFGFVEFREQKDAEDAVYDFNGKEFFGERIIVELARGERKRNERNTRERKETSRYGPPQRTQYRVVVENLATSASWQDLKDFMRKAGEVTFADAHRNREGSGVVEFSSHDEMKSAIKELNDSDLKGKRIVLKEELGRPRRRSDSNSPQRGSRRTRSQSRSPRDRGDRRRNARPRSRSPRDKRDRRRSPRSRSRSPRERESRRKASRSPIRHFRSGSKSPVQVNGRGPMDDS